MQTVAQPGRPAGRPRLGPIRPNSNIADTRWLIELSGLNRPLINRWCRQDLIPGAFTTGGKYWFRKDITKAWFESLGTNPKTSQKAQGVRRNKKIAAAQKGGLASVKARAKKAMQEKGAR